MISGGLSSPVVIFVGRGCRGLVVSKGSGNRFVGEAFPRFEEDTLC